MRYYSYINKEYGFGEITKDVYLQLYGTEDTKMYISKLYRGEISIEDVPNEFKEEVAAAVEKRNIDWGTYESREVSGNELLKMVQGVLSNDAE